MFKRLSSLIKRILTALVAEEVPQEVAAPQVKPTPASKEQTRLRPDDLDEPPTPQELSLEEHFLNLENTELLLQQALNDPLQFLKDYGEDDFFQLGEDDPRVLTAPLPEVRYERSPGVSPSRPMLTGRSQDEPHARSQAHSAIDTAPTAQPARQLAPRAPLPKIKVPKSKKGKKKNKGPRVKYVKRSGDSFVQRGEEQREESENPLEYAYLLPYDMVRERSRAPSRYDHLSAHHSFAASERAAAMRTVIDSLDELILIHDESIKRREAFFESIQELIESKQLHYTEADAWWYHYNRATSYLEEQRVLKNARINHGALRARSPKRAPERSRSTRRELSKLQASLEMAHVNAPQDAQPAPAAATPRAARAEARAAQPPSTPTAQPVATQTSKGTADERGASVTIPAKAKSHKKKGSGRLFSSKLPHHDLSISDPETLSRDPSSLSLSELEMTMRPSSLPPPPDEER